MKSILKILVGFLGLILLLVNSNAQENTSRIIRSGRNITLANGVVQGTEETYDGYKKMHSYKGIPYAKPPVGNLRFKAPVPIGMFGTLQADKFGPECSQLSGRKFSGSEDCLYINVFTPDRIRNYLPVVVFIHPGAFLAGSGNTDIFGPETFIEEDVIVVSLNYRLGPLGFLSSGDKIFPGNYGLKDLILGLRWVQENIIWFGGNSNEVTIMGVSAGGAAVHALVLSPAAKGLFNKAISQSGSLFNPWAFNEDPNSTLMNLAYRLQLDTTDRNELLASLKEVSAERLIRAAHVEDKLGPVVGIGIGTFVPSVDPVDSLEVKVLPDTPINLIRTENVNKLPFILGFTSLENMDAIQQIETNKLILERYQQNLGLLLPKNWVFESENDKMEVIQTYLDLYFGGRLNSTSDFSLQWAKYVSDREFAYGISKMYTLHSEMQNVYYYMFNYTGSLSFIKRSNGWMDYKDVSHAEDMFYLFHINGNFSLPPICHDDEAIRIRERSVRLWCNFIKTGNPTPLVNIDPLITAKWLPSNPVDQNFIRLEADMTLDVRPFSDRLDTWHRLDKIFGQY